MLRLLAFKKLIHLIHQFIFILFTEKGTAQRHFKPQMASSVVFSIFSSFRNLFIYCSYSKTIVNFFERSFWNSSSCDALKFFLFEFYRQLGVCITPGKLSL